MKMKPSLLFLGLISFSLASFAQVTLTMGGDVNFNKNLKKVHPEGYASSTGGIVGWNKYTAGIKHLINGDLNFANIETVVSDRDDLVPEEKAYVFQSHPNALQHMINIGFNFFNLANNHTYDYGHEGIQETLNAFQNLKLQNPEIESFGVGLQPELLRPHVFKKNGYTFAVASISILDKKFRATEITPGLIHIWSTAEYHEILKQMRQTSAHYKIISIHFGTEGQVTLDRKQKDMYEYAIKHGDIDLVIGHHPHAVRPIQKIGNRYIFYSLGNYLMLGSANITQLPGGADFGLFAKLHLVPNALGRLHAEAVELTPLTNTHAAVKPLDAYTAEQRLRSLNDLAIDELGDDEAFTPFIFTNGKAIHCEDQIISLTAKSVCPR